MLHASRDNVELTGSEYRCLFPFENVQYSIQYEKHFILFGVGMPRHLVTLYPDDQDKLSIEFTNDFG